MALKGNISISRSASHRMETLNMWSGTKKKRREEGSSYRSAKSARFLPTNKQQSLRSGAKKRFSGSPPTILLMFPHAQVGGGAWGGYASSKSGANAEHLGETEAEHPEPDGLCSHVIESGWVFFAPGSSRLFQLV